MPKTAKQLAAENKRLVDRIDDLECDLADSRADAEVTAEILESARTTALEIDRKKRTRDFTISSLVKLSEELREQAWDEATWWTKTGRQHDSMPSTIIVLINCADRVKAIAEREAGHSLDFTVKG